MRKPFVGMAAIALAGCAGYAWLVAPPTAAACGGVFLRSMWQDVRRPSLAYEQALLIHDADRGREHFIRQVAFRASTESFGFVVPTPTRPEVSKVDGDPIERMRAMFPFRALDDDRKGEGLRTGSGGGVAPRGGGVEVLEQKKVGSFAAFVLSASDPSALAGWLTKHGLTSSRQTDAWLAHFVQLHFFYVAMRYDPPVADPKQAAETRAEIVRFSFDTPLPYYPYFEPAPFDASHTSESRMAEIWFVSQRPAVPVALSKQGDAARWVRPFVEGRSYTYGVRADLERALRNDRGLLPGGELGIQGFVDQKSSRQGFGDVLFLPKTPVTWDAATRQRIAPLLPVLDPSLADGAMGVQP